MAEKRVAGDGTVPGSAPRLGHERPEIRKREATTLAGYDFKRCVPVIYVSSCHRGRKARATREAIEMPDTVDKAKATCALTETLHARSDALAGC